MSPISLSSGRLLILLLLHPAAPNTSNPVKTSITVFNVMTFQNSPLSSEIFFLFNQCNQRLYILLFVGIAAIFNNFRRFLQYPVCQSVGNRLIGLKPQISVAILFYLFSALPGVFGENIIKPLA